MPYKRKFKSRRKKNYKRRGRKGPSGTSVVNKRVVPNVFPNRLFCTMKYAESIQTSGGGLSYFKQQFNCNSIYDPNSTGTGHQPQYHDVLALVYNRYRVRGYRYDITISNVNTPCKVAIAIINGSSAPVGIDEIAEQPYSRQYVLNTMANGGGSVKRIKGFVKLSKILGENVLDDRDQAIFGNSPTNVVHQVLQFHALDGSTVITSANMYVRLTYYVEVFDRLNVTSS